MLFNNTTWANLGDTTGVVGSTGAGSLYISLHTATTSATSAQNASEATYTGYGRVAVARSSAGWTIAGQSVTNAATIAFNVCTGGSNTITDVIIGRDSGSSTGEALYWGALSASLAVSNGITPQFTTGALSVAEA